MFDRILQQIKPTHVLVAWDAGRETFRNDIDPNYKANREKKNDDLYVQFADIKEVLQSIGIKNVGIRGYEGDDIVGTYATMSYGQVDRTFIVSGDRDSFQLVNDKVYVIYPKNGFAEIEIITPEYVVEKYGIPVEQFIDLKSLMGDEGDNVFGISSCGEKTAVKLLQHFGSAAEVANNAGNIEVKGVNKNVKEGIIEWAPRFETVKKLVTIKIDVDVPYEFEDCEIELNWENARTKFKELECNSLVKKLNGGEFYGQQKTL
jgi:DNA polymerase-1